MSNGSSSKKSYDFVFGADGVHSVIRKAFSK
jgi:2-polyprenyl-6-methoxyphenol hydroxylase-like FAD-dependent oxidoreductase